MFLAESFDYTGIIVAIVVVLFIVLVIVVSVIDRKQNALVNANSPYLKEIRLINSKYNFVNIRTTTESKTFYLNSKKQFDNFNYQKRGTFFVRENQGHFAQIVESIKMNRKLLTSYNAEIKAAKNTSDERIADACRMKLQKFVKKENALVTKLIIHPTVNYSLVIKWEYTSPAGRNHYSDKVTFNFDELEEIINIRPGTYIVIGENNRDYSSNRKNTVPMLSINDIDDLDD